MSCAFEQVLFVQFANSMFLRHSENDKYWDSFYECHHDIGYYMGKYVFEPPKWIAEICYFLTPNINRELLWVVNSISEAIEKINSSQYDVVFFSLMNCNQMFIAEIVNACPSQKFIIGGYNDKFLKYLGDTYENVTIADTIRDCANALGLKYSYGTDYTLFLGDYVVPRLTLSSGCLNNCKFCIVPHGKIIEYPFEKSVQQIHSFNSLNYRLIYVDDKTFGQADNHTTIKELGKIINDMYPQKGFNGFVVQTTSGMVVKKGSEFADIGVKVAEIGMETYNDPILRKYNKPSSCKLAEMAIEEGNKNGIKMIANVIVGIPEEDNETYQRTFDFVMPKLESGELIGLNFSIYTDYSSEFNLGEIDFAETDKKELHKTWWDKFNKAATEIMDNKITENKNLKNYGKQNQLVEPCFCH